MPTVATFALLFVAAGLLVLAGAGIGRWRGRPASARDEALMAGMTGVAATFLFFVMPVVPLVILPMTISGVLIASWLADRRRVALGAFLLGSGLLLSVASALRRLNDLADPAVTIPGWTPIPLALGVAATIVGLALLIGARSSGARA